MSIFSFGRYTCATPGVDNETFRAPEPPQLLFQSLTTEIGPSFFLGPTCRGPGIDSMGHCAHGETGFAPSAGPGPVRGIKQQSRNEETSPS
jgi:hypothetical protein